MQQMQMQQMKPSDQQGVQLGASPFPVCGNQCGGQCGNQCGDAQQQFTQVSPGVNCMTSPNSSCPPNVPWGQPLPAAYGWGPMSRMS
mmetsp:Transcript_11802/g.22991  ORF Transcript_11802/g.22991 Transcript_11802/m.22991 type:complete len:87 (+) Transcript_11802:1-261(+)